MQFKDIAVMISDQGIPVEIRYSGCQEMWHQMTNNFSTLEAQRPLYPILAYQHQADLGDMHENVMYVENIEPVREIQVIWQDFKGMDRSEAKEMFCQKLAALAERPNIGPQLQSLVEDNNFEVENDASFLILRDHYMDLHSEVHINDRMLNHFSPRDIDTYHEGYTLDDDIEIITVPPIIMEENTNSNEDRELLDHASPKLRGN